MDYEKYKKRYDMLDGYEKKYIDIIVDAFLFAKKSNDPPPPQKFEDGMLNYILYKDQQKQNQRNLPDRG